MLEDYIDHRIGRSRWRWRTQGFVRKIWSRLQQCSASAGQKVDSPLPRGRVPPYYIFREIAEKEDIDDWAKMEALFHHEGSTASSCLQAIRNGTGGGATCFTDEKTRDLGWELNERRKRSGWNGRKRRCVNFF